MLEKIESPYQPPFHFKNRCAIVTGGNGGIGAATAQLLTNLGARVYVWDLNIPENKIVGVIYQTVNVTSLESCENAVKEIIQREGKIDILISNAGILRDASLLKMSPEQWEQLLSVNLSGAFYVAKAVVPHMKEKGYGRIIHTSSIVGQNGNFGQSNYAAAKAGIIGFTKSLSRELGRYGITVNAVAPGFIETPMTETIPDTYREKMIASIPVGRAGKPIDIAQAFIFLASEEASFISGSVLNVDGGMLI